MTLFYAWWWIYICVAEEKYALRRRIDPTMPVRIAARN